MTARVEAERAIADVLDAHTPPSRINSKEGWAECGCGERYAVEFVDHEMGYYADEWEMHTAHLAPVLADLMAERQAEAWDEGFNDGAHYASADLSHATYRTPPPANPYRPDPKDTRDE